MKAEKWFEECEKSVSSQIESRRKISSSDLSLTYMPLDGD
jgi:hypothetical protein